MEWIIKPDQHLCAGPDQVTGDADLSHDSRPPSQCAASEKTSYRVSFELTRKSRSLVECGGMLTSPHCTLRVETSCDPGRGGGRVGKGRKALAVNAADVSVGEMSQLRLRLPPLRPPAPVTCFPPEPPGVVSTQLPTASPGTSISCRGASGR